MTHRNDAGNAKAGFSPISYLKGHARPLNLTIAVLAVALFLWLSRPGDVLEVLGEVGLGQVALALLLNLPMLGLLTLRSNLLLRRMGHRVALSVLLPATVLGNVAGNVTPGAAGELLRVTALRRNTTMQVDEGVSLVVYERAVSVYLILLSAGAVLALTNLPRGAGVSVAVGCVCLVLLPWLFAVALGERLAAFEPSGQSVLARATRYLLGMAGEVRFLLRDARLLLAWSSLTLAVFALIALQIYLLGRGISAGLEYDDAWVAYAGTALSGIASLLPLGIGISDGSLAALVHQAGPSLEQGVAVAILFRATVTMPLVAVAALSHLYLSRGTETAAERDVSGLEAQVNGPTPPS